MYDCMNVSTMLYKEEEKKIVDISAQLEGEVGVSFTTSGDRSDWMSFPYNWRCMGLGVLSVQLMEYRR